MKSQFTEITVNKQSIDQRNPIFGVGINDAEYKIRPRVNGKPVMCLFYQRWVDMIRRCYSSLYQDKNKTYIGCTVTNEWLTFSSFKDWMVNQDWKGKHLDKDIINPGNKVYSPENCRFVTSELNNLILDSAAIRGNNPQGVYFNKEKRRHRAQISIKGKVKGLGQYPTQKLASEAYIKAKVELITKISLEQTDKSVANGLLLHAELLIKGNN